MKKKQWLRHLEGKHYDKKPRVLRQEVKKHLRNVGRLVMQRFAKP